MLYYFLLYSKWINHVFTYVLFLGISFPFRSAQNTLSRWAALIDKSHLGKITQNGLSFRTFERLSPCLLNFQSSMVFDSYELSALTICARHLRPSHELQLLLSIPRETSSLSPQLNNKPFGEGRRICEIIHYIQCRVKHSDNCVRDSLQSSEELIN